MRLLDRLFYESRRAVYGSDEKLSRLYNRIFKCEQYTERVWIYSRRHADTAGNGSYLQAGRESGKKPKIMLPFEPRH